MRPGPGVRSGDGATIGRVARAATALIVATGVLAVPLAELAGADQTPTIAIESPERGATLGDTVTLSGTASDDSQITRVRVKVNRRVPFGKSLLWDGSQFVDGYHAFNASLTPTADGSVDWTVDIPMPVGRGIRFAAIAYDDDGNRSTDYRVFVTQGAVPPTFTVDQPLDGAAVPSTATFSGTAMDDGTVNHVHVLIRRGSEYWNGTTWTSDHPGRDSVGKATLTHVPEGILTGRNATWQSELPLPPGETVLAEIVVVDDADRVTKQTIEVHVEEAPEPAAAVTIDAPSSGDAVPARTTVSGTAAYDEIVDVEDFRSVLDVNLVGSFVAARAALTLDYLTDGKFTRGIGAGWIPGEYEATGIPFRTRGARLEESIHVLRTLWQEPEASHDGEFYRFGSVRFDPKPVGETIPIHVGGDSQVALDRAARLGDGWIGSWHEADQLAEHVGYLHSRLAAAGRRTDGYEVTVAATPIDADDVERYVDAGATRMLVTPWQRSADAVVALERLADQLRDWGHLDAVDAMPAP